MSRDLLMMLSATVSQRIIIGGGDGSVNKVVDALAKLSPD
jgi:diacylglycerol kinase family enzyme